MVDVTAGTKADTEEGSSPAARRKGVIARLQKLIGLGRARNGRSIQESLEGMLDDTAEGERVFSAEERLMFRNLLEFGQLRVDDAMVPRADIIAVEVETSFADLVRIFTDAAHSRMPVYRETLDDPLGMIHIKDVLSYMMPTEEKEGADTFMVTPPSSLLKLKRDVLFVPPSMPAIDLLLRMQTTRVHMALVIDEYGGTDGLVTIEDLVELIVGDIEDEHDVDEEPGLSRNADGRIVADARVELSEISEFVGRQVVSEEEEEEIDTLGGLVFSILGRIPVRGEIVRHPAGLEFEVTDVDLRRIKRLLITVKDPEPLNRDTDSEVF